MRLSILLSAVLLCALFSGACDPSCPAGTTQVGGICRVESDLHPDAGSAGSQPDESAGTGTKSGTQVTEGGVSGRAAGSGGNAAKVRGGSGGDMPGSTPPAREEAGASGHSGSEAPHSADVAMSVAGASAPVAGASGGGGAGGVMTCMQECCSDSTCPSGAKCEQGHCHCPDGQHLCNDACVTNSATATCGAGCEACPVPSGGTATCDGVQCGASCPAGTRACAGDCVSAETPCNDQCPMGTHNCNNNCVSDSSVTGCGTSCMPCKVPAHAKATCNGSSCDFTCGSSYKRCDSACVEAEGACCTIADCNSRNHEQCDVGSHRCACADGFKQCNGQCIADSACCSSTDCGSGKVCNTASHGCECDANSKMCNGTCISKTACCAATDTGSSCRDGSTSGVCSSSGRCVECAEESDCTSRNKHCDLSRNTCVNCRGPNDCPGGEFARCTNDMCTLAEGCGNGKVDGSDECDVGGVGASGTAAWTSTTCTSDCKTLIYVTSTSAAAAGCTSPRVSNDIVQCTVNCSSDSDCPALGKGYPRAKCNATGMGTCQIPCSGNNECLTSSGATCIELLGLPSKPKLCANPGF
jgi:hypothetical protein